VSREQYVRPPVAGRRAVRLPQYIVVC
jgi:hypothetical protein